LPAWRSDLGRVSGYPASVLLPRSRYSGRSTAPNIGADGVPASVTKLAWSPRDQGAVAGVLVARRHISSGVAGARTARAGYGHSPITRTGRPRR
jgi:hypothetical protein